jgi:hypothetical protein
MAAELSAKRLSLLHELMPSAARIALLLNPANPVPAETMAKDTEAAAETIGRHIDVYQAETSREIEMAFAALVRDRANALLVGAEPFFIDRRVQIVTLSTRYLLPTVHFLRESSGAIARSASIPAAFSRARNRPTCRSCSQPSSSWSSTCQRRERSVSSSHRACSRRPTK